jgi:uncharacterized damage-inducible protein DinB
MVDTLHRAFLDYSAEKLRQASGRIEACLGKLTPQQVWARGSENENAIGNLVLHLCGNVRQWIVAGVGGAADLRRRDSEFAARGGVPVGELVERLRAVVAEAAGVLGQVTVERLGERIVVQNYDTTVLGAIYHVVEHFSGHTGQIIFATKMLTGADLAFYQHLRTAAPHGQKTP